MAKRKQKASRKELDSVFVLKMIFYVLLGAMWIRIDLSTKSWGIPIPVGFLIGLFLVRHERFQIDRKIEYALLVGAMFVSFFLPFGLIISI